MNFKQFLASKNITPEAFAELDASEVAKLYNEYNETRHKAFEDLLAKTTSKKELDTAVKALEDANTELKDLLDEAGLKVTEMKTKLDDTKKSETTLSVIKGLTETLKKPFEGTGKAEFSISKAAVLAGTAITNNTIGLRDNELSPLAHRKLTMYDIFRKVRFGKDNGGSIKYIDWDEATVARAAATIAEGGTFPESTARWIERNIDIKKVGDSIPVSEEMVFDHARFAGELEKFLETNVKLEEDNQLLLGTGAGTQMAGLDTSAIAYVAAASGIQDASFYDLIPKVRESISKGKGSKFNGNIVLMNLTEINKYKLKKDANNNYVMPPFYDRDGNRIDGALVVENNNVADNVCYVGDSNYGTIYESEEGYSIEIDMVNNQFLEDMKTMKARKRECLLIKESEKAAWRKVASISAALTTLAT